MIFSQVSSVDMQYSLQTSKEQQELADTLIESEQTNLRDKRPSIENHIVHYNEAREPYLLSSTGKMIYVDSSELFQKVSNGVTVSIPRFSIKFQYNEDTFIKEENDLLVEQITVDGFMKKNDNRINQLNHQVSFVQCMTA